MTEYLSEIGQPLAFYCSNRHLMFVKSKDSKRNNAIQKSPLPLLFQAEQQTTNYNILHNWEAKSQRLLPSLNEPGQQPLVVFCLSIALTYYRLVPQYDRTTLCGI